jgi:putative peptide zinc metalloprotease protein
MAGSLFSPSWYRVAKLKPRLRVHAELHRHWIRGEVWYILQDHQSGRFHRVSPAANLMICLMDGRRTLDEIWDLVGSRMPDHPPTQDETIRLLAELHSADLLTGDAPPDVGEIADRSQQQASRRMMQRLRSPLSMRFPLLDPDGFLSATLPLVRPLFTRLGFIAWLLLIGTGVVLAVLHWPELTADVGDRVLVAHNLVLLALAYPVVKAFHELGHGYATKAWGGEVHEFGVMLLVLIPMPYVDASASMAFREKWRRMVVGGAGIMVELALAAVAIIVWAAAEPGVIRALAFNVMLIGGVSTLLFNGNPLLRYDGYYILSDLIEIPNLATRANRYFFYLMERHLFGIDWVENPATAASERKWLFAYAVLAFLYRIVLVVGIAFFVAGRFFFIGILLALWAVAGMFLLPIGKGLKYVLASPRLHDHRGRGILVAGGTTLVLAALLFAVPVPYATVAEGVVAVPERSAVRARTDGVVTALLAPAGGEVAAGRALFQLEDPLLPAAVAVLKAERAEMQLRLDAARVLDRVQTDMLAEQLNHLDATLALSEQHEDDLTLSSDAAGRFIVPGATDLVGRFVTHGDLLGYVVGSDDPVLRVVVPQADIDLVRQRPGAVEVRFAEDPLTIYRATIRREVPAADNETPSLALTSEGGGALALDPSGGGKRTLERLFQLEVALEGGVPPPALGSRAYVRFSHGSEPIAGRLIRGLRQVFLSHFHV